MGLAPMKRLSPAFLALMGVCAGLGGCDSMAMVTFTNWTPGPIGLHQSDADFTLAPGASKTVKGFGRVMSPLSVKADGCVYSYAMPHVDGMNFAWFVPDGRGGMKPDERYPYPLKEIVAPDMRIYLASRRARSPAEYEKLAADQAHGFPLIAASKACG